MVIVSYFRHVLMCVEPLRTISILLNPGRRKRCVSQPTSFVCLAFAGRETNTLVGIVDNRYFQNGSEPQQSPALDLVPPLPHTSHGSRSCLVRLTENTALPPGQARLSGERWTASPMPSRRRTMGKMAGGPRGSRRAVPLSPHMSFTCPGKTNLRVRERACSPPEAMATCGRVGKRSWKRKRWLC